MRYALSRWAALTRYCDDGRLEIDNNAAERSIRPIATRRSLCSPSSSIWEHWNLVFEIDATRATSLPDGGGNPFVLQV
jgi:transposase